MQGPIFQGFLKLATILSPPKYKRKYYGYLQINRAKYKATPYVNDKLKMQMKEKE